MFPPCPRPAFRFHLALALSASLTAAITPRATLAQSPAPTQSHTKYPGTSTATAHSIYGAPEPMFGAMPLVAPVFLQTDQIDSSITVVNGVTFAVNGTVTLRDQQGTVIGKQTLSFPSHSSTPVAMKTLLAAAGSQAHSGSVTLEQDPALKGPALLAQLSMTLHSGSQPSFLEEEFGMPTAHGSATLQGVASQARNLPLIAITSVSEAPQTIHATCVGENKTASTIDLPAFGTAVVQACSWQAVLDGALSLSSSLLSSPASADTDHAVSLTSDSVPGAFYAFGFALNGGLDQPQLQPLDFYDPGTLQSGSTTYVGVPTGATALLSAVLSAPVLTLANFSSAPHQTTVTWSDSSSGTPKVRELANLTLPPFSTQTTTLSATAGTGLLNSFTIASDGKPGDIQAHLFTRVGTSRQRTELLAKDTHDDHNSGNHPWSLANGDQSTLLLYNSAKAPQIFEIRISGEGNSWQEIFTLAPDETRAVSLNEIIMQSKPDHQKRTLPKTLARGEVQWKTEHGGAALGRLLVTNSTTYLARSFSCPTYTAICGASFGPENFEDLLLEGDPVSLSSVQPTFCTEYCSTCCGQSTTTGSYYSYSTSWSASGSASIVTPSSSYVSMKGTSLGTFYVNGNVQGQYCSAPVSGGGSVVNVTTSPSSISMSNGDTSVSLQVSVNPASSASSATVSATLQSNPGSASAATLSFSPPGSFTGNDAWTIKASGSNSPSGIFNATACVGSACAQNPTVITIPPQIIIQMLYGEAHGQVAAGDNASEPALGAALVLRLNNSAFGSPSTYQAAITPQQFNGIKTSITTGTQPELANAVAIFNGTSQANTGGGHAFSLQMPPASLLSKMHITQAQLLSQVLIMTLSVTRAADN